MDARGFLTRLLYNIDIGQFMFNYYSKTLCNGWAMPASHSHNALEILCVVNGTSYFKFPNDIVKMEKNDVLVIAPGIEHRLYIENNDTCELVCVQFNLDILSYSKDRIESSIFPELYVLNERNCLKVPGNKLIRDCMKRIVVEMSLKEDNFDSFVKAEVTNLLIYICRILQQLEKAQTGINNQNIRLAIDYINKSLDKKLIPQDIANAIHISPHYLMHLFHDITGTTLMRFVNNARIDRSKILLIQTNDSITEISNSVGFDTLQYFSIIFKKTTGISPIQFRKISQNLDYLKVNSSEIVASKNSAG